MRALVIFSSAPKTAEMAKNVAKGLSDASFQVQLRAAEAGSSENIPCAAYDVVCVGSPVVGTFGGGVAEDVAATVKRCLGLQGKHVAVFVRPKLFGVQKSLRRLMALLEGQGALVQDFAALRQDVEGEEFGRRLDALGKKSP